jgi:hypothetical protein
MKKYIPVLLATLFVILCQSPICENIDSIKLSKGIHIYIENYNSTINGNQMSFLYLFGDTIVEKAIEDTTYSRQNYRRTVFKPFSLSNYIGTKLSIGLALSSSLVADTCFLDTLTCEDTTYFINVYIDSFPYQSAHKEFMLNFNNKTLRIYYEKQLID